jgi:regulator of nonsense transcripts 1
MLSQIVIALLINFLIYTLNSKSPSQLSDRTVELIARSVPTETYIGRFDREAVPYSLNLLTGFDWSEKPSWFKDLFVPKQSIEDLQGQLASRNAQELELIMSFCLEYHADLEMFWTFDFMITTVPLADGIRSWVERFPPLAFSLLKKYPPDDSCCLKPEIAAIGVTIIRNIIRSANSLGIAILVALEKISSSISQISMADYLDLLMLAAHSVRSSHLAQEVLLVLNDARAPVIAQSDIFSYVHKHALAIAFDRAEEAADECPCDEHGTPRKRSSAIPILQLLPVADELAVVVAHVRIDTPNAVRLHSHVRLEAAAEPQRGLVECPVIDGIVVQASKGELKLELQYPPPPEMVRIQWKMYTAGSVGR